MPKKRSNNKLGALIGSIMMLFAIGYLTYKIIPQIIYFFSHNESPASITLINETSDKYIVEIKFYNKFIQDSVKVRRKINKNSWQGRASSKVMNVAYPKYFHRFTVIKDIDNPFKPIGLYLFLVLCFIMAFVPFFRNLIKKTEE